MSDTRRVPCSRCGETLLVWVEGDRFYVGCPYKGCALTVLPHEADAAINLAWHGPSPAPSQQHLDDEGERMAAQAFDTTHALRRCEQP